MLEVLVVIILVALVGSNIFQYLNRRNDKQGLQEYKSLFETADVLQREAQIRVETLLQEAGDRNVLMERASQNLEFANKKLLEQQAVLVGNAEAIVSLQGTVAFQDEQYKKLFSQKKSSEVRTGKITEQISPFLDDYPLSPSTARFIGDPIDFVHFDEDKVTFVEVKSGKSQLSKKQRLIRDLVEGGKVEFTVYRVEGK